MLLEIFGFLHMSLTDILDILMVTGILFVLFRWIRGSSAMKIFVAILLLLVMRVIVEALNMKMMTSLLKTIFDIGILAIIIIFQPEIRHILNRLGTQSTRWRRFLDRFLKDGESTVMMNSAIEIAEACRVMSEQKVGALIVIPGRGDLQRIIETGDIVDAVISRRLIMNLFFKNSPLHDGAMIINRDRIVASRCTLPITSRADIPANFGMRHRAAIGITEETDATVLIVSEETGSISYARGGNITHCESAADIITLLCPADNQESEKDKEGKE